jgi:hypothetical protein
VLREVTLRGRRHYIEKLPNGALIWLAAAEGMLKDAYAGDNPEEVSLRAQELAAWFDDPQTDAAFPGIRKCEAILVKLLPELEPYRGAVI